MDHHHEDPNLPIAEEIDSKAAEAHMALFTSEFPDFAQSSPSQHRDARTSSTKVTRSVSYHEETGRTPAGIMIRTKDSDSTILNKNHTGGMFRYHPTQMFH